MAAIVGVFVVLPIVLKSRCIDAAAERGVALTIDHVDIGLGDVRIIKPGFALEGVPQLSAHADDAQVAFSGLSPGETTIHNLALTIDGPAKEVQEALDGWRATQAKRTAGSAPGRKISFTTGHLIWTRAFGQTVRIETVDAEGDADPATSTLRLTAEHLNVTANQATFGPWRTTLERDTQQTRTDIELDPVMHGGPALVYVRTAAGAVSVKLNVPASPLSHIGIPPKTVKLGSDPQVEAQVAFDETAAGASTLSATLSLAHAAFSGAPIDAKLHLEGAGDLSKGGLDIRQGTLVAGPLDATVSGTMNL